MGKAQQTQLPRILVIDDQFGRSSLGNRFLGSVSSDIAAGYQADRQNLCANYGLLDITNDAKQRRPIQCIAEAMFCPAQRWNESTNRIENSSDVALEMVRRGWPFNDGTRWALVLLDLRFVYGEINVFGDPQEGSLFGIDVLLPELRKEFGEDLPIVVLSSTQREENNPTVRKLGALDFIQRVPGAGDPPDRARETLQKALFSHGLFEDKSGVFAGRSVSVLKALRQARRGAVSARNILLFGETGTGKGLLAEYIHRVSPRKNGPFEVFHAAHRPGDLQADELFGHWKGAFTGAEKDNPGIWERANGGTLFIDEVADIDLKVQQMLMQPIEERRVRRLGQPASGVPELTDVDVLVLLATNRSLQDSKTSGTMKLDFVNRIDAFPIEVPPLRERQEDIPQLVSRLAEGIVPSWRGRFLPDTIGELVNHDWREGNVRELRNVIERALINNPDQDITPKDIELSRPNEQPYQEATDPTHMSRERNRPHWEACFAALKASPESLSVADSEAIRRNMSGSFLGLVTHILEWSLRLNTQESKPNLTATARFLLGRDDVSTMEAKQFLRKLLTLDTRGKQIARRLSESKLCGQHDTLSRLIKTILKEHK